MTILDVIEAAEWLGETIDVVKLERLKELSDNHRFYVTVWGHYSAGKSLLINNILEKLFFLFKQEKQQQFLLIFSMVH